LFDGSVIEKPESRTLEASGPVLSSKAKRLTRSRPGLLFNLPALRPIRVMGMEWTGTIITGLEGIPKLAIMRWWTTKGDYAEKLRQKEEEVLRVLVRRWGPLLTFVFDRGYASGRLSASPGAIWRPLHHSLDQEAHLLRSGRPSQETVGDWPGQEISLPQTDPRELHGPQTRL
jgi:hypothetical protein